jgi:hypothetical protein
MEFVLIVPAVILVLATKVFDVSVLADIMVLLATKVLAVIDPVEVTFPLNEAKDKLVIVCAEPSNINGIFYPSKYPPKPLLYPGWPCIDA